MFEANEKFCASQPYYWIKTKELSRLGSLMFTGQYVRIISVVARIIQCSSTMAYEHVWLYSIGSAMLPCHSTSILVAFFSSGLELFLFSRVEMRWSMRDLNAWSISIWALKICVQNSLCFSFVLLTALKKRQKGQLSPSD